MSHKSFEELMLGKIRASIKHIEFFVSAEATDGMIIPPVLAAEVAKLARYTEAYCRCFGDSVFTQFGGSVSNSVRRALGFCTDCEGEPMKLIGNSRVCPSCAAKSVIDDAKDSASSSDF